MKKIISPKVVIMFAALLLSFNSFSQLKSNAQLKSDVYDKANVKSGPKHKILMIVSNKVMHPSGYELGFFGSELVHPYYYFTEAGYEMTIASADGGKVFIDKSSDPEDAISVMKDDILTLGFMKSPKLMALLENTPKAGDLKVTDFDAIVVAGGSAPILTFPKAIGLQKLFAAFYEAGKPSATLCHGSSLLLFSKLSNGDPIAKGRTFTGYCNEEEDLIDNGYYGGKRFNSYRIEEEAKKLGANFVKKPILQSFAVRDGNLITGQQQNSGKAVADLVIEMIGK